MIESQGLQLHGIESVNIHDSIKAGTDQRDHYIDIYRQTLRNLATVGVDLVCYNFMPVFDWTRTDLAKVREDGSTVLAYDQQILETYKPDQMLHEMGKKSNDFLLPGWEPERLGEIRELLGMYRNLTEEHLFQNLVYFLEAIIPICEETGIRMAIHPDDPPWSVFGLPRIVKNRRDLERVLGAVDSPYNCATLCTGSLGSNPDNPLVDIIRSLGNRIAFAHVRNLRHTAPGVFEEAAHFSSDGSFDLYAIMEALYDVGFDGVIRPDHGRAIWNEVSLPGYGLYDRALGSQYLLGIWDSLLHTKTKKKRISVRNPAKIISAANIFAVEKEGSHA
jgi:mannonate dehydratase